MAGTFKKIDYRLRPAKHAERTMLIDLFKRMRFAPIENYQYIGFGSVAFVDFRMVHRSLGIRNLFSIEDAESEDDELRFTHNKPYQGIDLRFGNASAVLPTIDFSKLSLVWLDYDVRARRSMINDLTSVVRDAPSGSFVALTFTNEFPTNAKEAAKQLTHLKEGFPEFVAEDDQAIKFQGPRYAEFVRATFGALLDTALADADAGKQNPLDKRVALQVCYFKYSDGAPMATLGWVIVAERDLSTFEECDFNGLPFVRMGADSFRIAIPLVTPLEVREMERRLPNLAEAGDIDWIPEEERKKFVAAYRYLPNFAPVEAI